MYRHKDPERGRNGRGSHCRRSEMGEPVGKVNEFADSPVIHGGQLLLGCYVDTYDDHRITIRVAVMGLRVPGIHIQNPDRVNELFPNSGTCGTICSN